MFIKWSSIQQLKGVSKDEPLKIYTNEEKKMANEPQRMIITYIHLKNQ